MGKGNSIPIPFLCLFFLSLSSIISISAVDFPINVWPKPTNISWPTPQATTLSLNFTVTVTSSDNPFLYAAAVRYSNLFLFEKHHFLVEPNLNLTSSPPLQSLHVTVSDATIPLAHGVDESYSLTVPTDSITANLTAKTAWGAIRGLETFSQLIYGDPPMVASGLYIEDQPLYLHRGVMLDTSRNYYGVDDLLRLIEAMSMNKLNVFHWHVTDSHSFPLELPSVAELAEKGAYGKDMLYSVDDVKKIVEFGMEHGVRVMPEIDMPGHTGSWAEAYPEIVTCANMFWAPTGSNAIAAEPGPGQLNPLNPRTYEVVENVIRDTLSMFPDSLYHSGADEINPNCWKTDPTIQDFLAKNGTLSQLLEKFINTTLPPILSQNRTVVYWEDVMLDATVNVTPSLLPKEKVILQTWNNGPNNTKRIVSAGYRAIVSSADYYYLDCGHGDFTGGNSIYDLPPGSNQGNGGSWCGPFKTWQIIYNYDITYGLTKDEAKLVIGGEVALWSEQADSTVMDPRIWPRSSAFGETMWSGNRDESGKKRYGEANDRLIEWRYRMVKRGIGAEPIQPLWCIKHPGMCNTVSDN